MLANSDLTLPVISSLGVAMALLAVLGARDRIESKRCRAGQPHAELDAVPRLIAESCDVPRKWPTLATSVAVQQSVTCPQSYQNCVPAEVVGDLESPVPGMVDI